MKRPLPITRVRFLMLALAALLLVSLSGCPTTGSKSHKKRDFSVVIPRFFMESGNNESGIPVTLPVSGVAINIGSRPVFMETDIVGVELVQTQTGPFLFFKFTNMAQRDLYRTTVSNVGRRFVLTLNDVAVGARPIEHPIGDGGILVSPEVPEAQLPTLMRDLRGTIAEAQEAVAKNQ